MKNRIPAEESIPQVGIVGTGYWGKNLVRALNELKALASICDADPEVLSQFQKIYPQTRIMASYSDLIQDDSIQGVVISTPATTHGKLVREALLAGKDVLVEKPLCLDVSEARELVNLANREKRILMVGHLLWYHPAVLKLKELVDKGDLGKIRYIYSNRLNLGKFRREENILWSFAPHDISVILGLLGELPETVEAHGGSYLHDRIEDVTVNFLSFPNGVKAHIFVSWLHPYKEQKLIVVGDRKMAVFNDVEKKDKLLLFPHSIDWKNQIPVPNRAEAEVVSFEPEEPLKAECRHFLECIESRAIPRTSGEEGLRVLSVLQRSQDALVGRPPSEKWVERKKKEGFFAHESAFIDSGVQIGEGTKIWHISHILKGSRIGNNCRIGQNVVIGPNVRIGNGVKIQNNVSVYDGVTLEDDVFCGPSMVFTNVINPRSEFPRMEEKKTTLVKKGSTIGANSTILCGLTLGQYSFVGAGSMVTADIPDFGLVLGNPSRLKGWMCRCGEKLGKGPKRNSGTMKCRACGLSYVLNTKGLLKMKNVGAGKDGVNESPSA